MKSSKLADSNETFHSDPDISEIQSRYADMLQGKGPEKLLSDTLAVKTQGKEHHLTLDILASYKKQGGNTLSRGNGDFAGSLGTETATSPLCSLGDGYNKNCYHSTFRAMRELGMEERNTSGSHVLDEVSSKLEIQSIIDQFDDGDYDDKDQPDSKFEVSSPRPSLNPSTRKSRLESIQPPSRPIDLIQFGTHSAEPSSYAHDLQKSQETVNLETSKASVKSYSTVSLHTGYKNSDNIRTSSPRSSMSIHKALPPAPDPEPDLPFDFHRFLEQLRHRTADPVAKFLRSFLNEFGKKQWMVHEQVKIISDFLTFITNKMAQCEVWREVSDAEFDNAKEGMEKLVMNRLYTQTFSPTIPPPISITPMKGKGKSFDKVSQLGRRGQHQEDIERDEVLAHKVRIYGWVKEEHLDIAPVGESGRRFLSLAQQGSL